MAEQNYILAPAYVECVGAQMCPALQHTSLIIHCCHCHGIWHCGKTFAIYVYFKAI